MRMVEVNPSIDTLRDVLVILGYLAAIYGSALGAFGCAALAVAAAARMLRGERLTSALGFGAGHVAALAGAILFALGYAATGALGQNAARFSLRAALGVVAVACAGWAARSSLARIHGRKVALAYAGALLVGVCTLVARVAVSPRVDVEASVVPPVEAPTPAPVAAKAAVEKTTRRVFLIGVDGMDWRRIEPLRVRGRLPNIDRLIRRGVRSPMHTFLPSWSPILWTTIATGVSASVHGVYDFTEIPVPGLHCGLQRLRKARLLPEAVGLTRLVDTLFRRGVLYEVPVTGCQRRVEALWNVLSAQQKRVAVVNWFASWPAEPVNGYLISDHNPRRAAFFADKGDYSHPVDRAVSYPEDLLRTLGPLTVPDGGDTEAEILSLPFFSELRPGEREQLMTQSKPVLMFEHVYQSDEFVSAAALALLEREPVAFLAVYMSGIDNTSHLFGTNTGVVDRYYELMDEKIGALMARADADTSILLISDHGWEYENQSLFGHEHGPDGVFIATGPGIASGVTLANVPRLHDITPTVLALFGYPKAGAMEGEVVNEVATAPLPGAALARSNTPYVAPIVEGRVQGSPETDETMGKLRALGYVQ